MKLNDRICKTAQPKDKSYKLSDGFGLYLEITPKGAKYRRLKYRHEGTEKRISLGVYPAVTLKEARDKKEGAKKLIAGGIDPSFAKKEESRNKRIKSANTFEALGREWHAKKKGGWSEDYAKTILTRLEADIFPRIGGIPITDRSSNLIKFNRTCKK